MVGTTEQLLPVIQNGLDIYRSRLRDHFGRIHNGGLGWPRFGIRVPYAPMTLLDNVDPKDHCKDKGDDSELHLVRSMTAPIVPRPFRNWASTGEDPGAKDLPGYGSHGGSDGGESDDEGDNWYAS
jgi:hypothetical protein